MVCKQVSPCVGSAVFTPEALLASGDAEACAELLPGLADGTSVGTMDLGLPAA
ncbi:hypothetical protein ABH940_002596 [Streptacidiphilus sp. BW17]|uniref:hypothetical protein n=1 Tax=Streptacidiphilus sp. BW17 TaxID=3156274 RepID=UPI003519D779